MSKLLALDIKKDLLTAVVFTTDAKSLHITDYALVPVGLLSIEEALTELRRKIDLQDVRCHLALEADSFFIRNLVLPFTDSKTIHKILPLELEENAPVKIDSLLIDAMITRVDQQKSQVIAAMINRELLANRLASLQTLGLDPETVTISGIPTALRLINSPDRPADFLLLIIDLQRVTFILVRSDHITLIRSLIFDPGLKAGFHIDENSNNIKAFRPEHIDDTFLTLCTTIQQTLQSLLNDHKIAVYLSGPVGTMEETAGRIEEGLGVLCQSCTVVGADLPLPFVPQFIPPVDEKWLPGLMEDTVNLGWQITKGWKSFNFRKDDFATKKSLTDKKTLTVIIALPLLALALTAIIYLWVDYSRLLKEQNDLNAQIRAIFTETLPETTRIVDPIQQLQVKIKETKQSSLDKNNGQSALTMLDILAQVSANVPKTLDVRLARFVVDDSGIRLRGITDTYNSVDAIKKGLEQSSSFSTVEISAANLDPKSAKIRFEMKLTTRGT